MLAHEILYPVLIASCVGYLYLGVLYTTTAKETIIQETVFKNPFQLSEALILGLLFGVVIALVKFADTSFGELGVYIISFISGLTDTDAIALSLASLSKNGLDKATALNAITLAIIANSLLKSMIVFLLGTRSIASYVGGYLVLTIGTFCGIYYALS